VGHNESTDSGDEDNAALQLALKMSLDTTCNEQMSNSFVKQKVFLKILDDLVMSLSGSNHPIIQHHIPVMDLLLSLVFHSHGDEEKSFLGKMMCNRICDQISKLTKTFLENDEPLSSSSRLMRYSFVLCLKCLVCLLTNNNIINDKEVIPDDSHQDAHIFEGSTVNEKTREKTDPRFICEEHGVPAVRRRCSHGENKDRRFYVCGMERKNRCKYFKWADSTPSLKPHEKQRSSDVSKHAEVSYNSDLQQTLWSLLTNGDRDSPLQVQLCNLLQNILKKFETNGSLDLNALIDLDEKTACNTKDATISYLSLFNEDKESEKEDFTDGVTLSFDKLGPLRSEAIGLPSQYASFSRVNDSTFIETIVDLLSLVAMKSSTAVDSGASWKCWFAPLCEIISTNLSIKLRTQAKTMLKRLCGGRRAIYRRVRDHHVFGYLFSQLLLLCEQPLLAALSVKEKARRCGSMWMNPDWTWKTLPSGCFIGVEDLISEDSHTVNEMEKINKVLDDLISITKSRRKNWRHFCGLPKFPKNVRVTNCFNFLQDDGDIYDRSPYCLLLWIACALPVSKQIKVFQLMEVAFDSSHTPTSSSEPINQTGDDCGILSTGTDAGSDCEGSTPNNASSSSSYHPESIGPEEILLNGAGRFTTDDFFAFVYHFVLHGKDKEVRSLSSKVTQKLVKNLSTTQYDNLFYRLVALCQRDISELGCNATEYLSLLNALASDERILSSRYFKNIMSIILTCCIQQLTICLGIKSKSFNTLNMTLFEPELDKRNSQGKHMYDTASCARCHMRRPFFSNSHGTSGTSSSDEELKISWHPDQLRDFKKSRLDTLALKTVNTEFSNHVQLKTRLSISEIHLAIGDPRGRFVKTIIVYFSPRPVGDVNELKAVEYKPFWQRIGTLSVARGAGQASLKLTAPVVAANLKFEYLEFYEKINSGRSSDGTLLLHCPRCTRVVNNSHGGVCGHCGEVAFQCRKCRHINYDRLDAFFCVECGYCASGNFSFELLSGFATRAVSIVDDEGLERAAKLLRFFNKRHYEMKNMLMSKLRDCDHTSKVMKSLVGNDALFASTYGAALEQSLLGNLPNTNRKGTEESSEKDLAKKRRVLTTNYNSSQRQNDLSSRSAANRARSLLSLARQIRNESNLDDRTTRGDILLQQAILHSGGALGNEDIFQDDDMEMVDYPPPERLQNADIPDPLSRLVANIQARVRGVNNVGEISNPTDPNRAGAGSTLTKDNDTVHETRKKSGSPPLVVEDYDKLYHQMRESEKECFDLRKKIVAWKRLNRDAVANCGSALSAINVCESYIPVTCSHCAPSIALNLLTLVTTLIENNIPNSEQALTRDFVAALFEGSPQEERELHDLKRSVIVTVTTKSELGSQLVFHELQSRLHGGSDINSAEILGKLMENDFPSLGRFLDLAVTTLSKA
jgi:E3 ubiquitin-protein ligase UBR4